MEIFLIKALQLMLALSILVLLHEAPTLTGSNLAEYLDIGRGTVKEYLRRLKA